MNDQSFYSACSHFHVWGLRQEAGESSGISGVWQGAMPSSRGHHAESQLPSAAHRRQWISFSHMS